jgi:hypothetical protein
LQEQGWTVGFSPGAVVWHHRRDSFRAYLKQQFEYGKAEALLEHKWPERYNRAGHLAWAGRVYGNGISKARGWRRWKIYYGTWGTGLFQSVYQRTPSLLGSLPLMPEWYLVIAAVAAISAMGLLWTPLLFALPLCLLAAGALVFESMLGGMRASFGNSRRSRMSRMRMRAITTFLYLFQPAARLSGRIRFGLAPWRRRSIPHLAIPKPRTNSVWSERWQSPDARLRRIETELREANALVLRGGDYARWDLQVRGGSLGAARMRMAVEEHGAGRQLLRFRTWPKWSRVGLGPALLFGALAVGAALEGVWLVVALLAATTILLILIMFRDSATATGVLMRAIEGHADEPEPAFDPQTNGASPRMPRLASRLPSTNGSRTDAEHDVGAATASLGEIPSSSGGIAFPSPINMHERGLNITERED